MHISNPTKVRTLTKVFIAFGGRWFGPPVLMFEGAMIDGRSRCDAYQSLGKVADHAPVLLVESPRQAARALFRAGEYQRVVDMFEARLQLAAQTKEQRADLEATLMVDDASPLWPYLQRRSRARGEAREIARDRARHKRPSRAVKALAAHFRATLGEPLDRATVREILEPWL